MTSKTINPNQAPSPRLWFALILTHIFIPLILLVCGGDLSWWQGWVFCILFFLAGIGGRFLAENQHPGILLERVNMEKAKDAKSWDKVLAPLMAISLSFPLLIVAGLDHRFGWSSVFSIWLNILGLSLIALGYAFAAWAIIENRFFSSTVRIQTDRGHSVCDSGPYRIVRHPGYAGNLLALPAMALAFNSIWILIPVIVAFIIAVIRTALEDRTLQEELPGYQDYTQRVRYRLIPWIY